MNLPTVDQFEVENQSLDIDVVVDATIACPRYSGVTISGVKVTESPDWLKNRLNAIGLRPINNIVDITNFVLHETGQPLHAFDADYVKGNKVVIRKMPQNTPFVTLDEEERKLDAEDLMICNAEDGMCIGGVFGGIHSGVTEETKNIFLESAYFDPAHIRKTSRRHGLQTDASFRFERGADPNITLFALKRAALLFKEIAGGTITSEIKDVYPQKINPWEVEIGYKNVDRLIGKTIEREIIKEILGDLEIEIKEESNEGLKLLVPTFKVDVTREADIIEEILRIYGYNNVEFEDKISTSVSLRVKPDLEKIQNIISDQLTAKGFTEIMNNSLTRSGYYINNKSFDENKNVRLLNPLSQDLDVLRQTLLFGGLEVVAYNINRRLADQKLYEFGNTYSLSNDDKKGPLSKYAEEKFLSIFITGKKEEELWNSNIQPVDFYYLKGVVESIFNKLGIEGSNLEISEPEGANYEYALDYCINGKCLATISKLEKGLLNEFDIKQQVFYAEMHWDKVVDKMPKQDHVYKPVAKFPSVRRDLALVVDKNIRFDELRKAALNVERRILKSVSIFDIYEGDKIPDGKKSYAMSFILQDEEKTLTDKVIDKAMKRILQKFSSEYNAELR
jgi:phenylalanyl-tRNA synthetase beta chain